MSARETARSVFVDVAGLPWEPTGHPGVERKLLYADASGRQTMLVRMAPGARLPDHRHQGVEQSFVLEGTLVDEDGATSAGGFVWRKPGSVPTAWTPDGCLILAVFERPNEFLTSEGGSAPLPNLPSKGARAKPAPGADQPSASRGSRA